MILLYCDFFQIFYLINSRNVGGQQTIVSRVDIMMEIGYIEGSFKFIDVTNVGAIDFSSSVSRKLELILFRETILVSSPHPCRR